MIGVEMGEQYCVDAVAIDALLLHRNQRGRPAIHQESAGIVFDMDAGIEPAAGAERVAATDECHLHVAASAIFYRVGVVVLATEGRAAP
jgi:hypothetical protein